MSKWTAAIADSLASHCRQSKAGLEDALAAALGQTTRVEVSDPEIVTRERLLDADLATGLLFVFSDGDEQLLALLPADGNLVAGSVAEGDRLAKFEQLASQLNDLLFPTEWTAESAAVSFVEDLADELRQRTGETDWVRIDLVIASENATGLLRLVWPAKSDQAVDSLDGPDSEPVPSATPTQLMQQPTDHGRPSIQYADLDDGIKQLPPYSQSLLKIRVPVRVTLAETKLTMNRVLKLGPGSIIQFNKSCEDALSLEAGEQTIAQGEAVKVGDKFGLWITSMALPTERFFALREQGRTSRVQ